MGDLLAPNPAICVNRNDQKMRPNPGRRTVSGRRRQKSDEADQQKATTNVSNEQSNVYLQRAKSLLSRVNQAITNSTSNIGTVNQTVDYTLTHPDRLRPVTVTEALPQRLENLTLDNEVQLILDGIPEIQFGDDSVTDDLVDHLLQLGGKPPSQLQLPTAQLNHSEVLNTLPKVTHLRISLRNLSVFSARYGVRKEGTYLEIHTPHYYEISLGNNPYHVNAPDLGDHLPSQQGKKPQNTSPLITRRGQDHRLPLKELEALDEPKPVIVRKDDKKDSIKKFFLGDCSLDYIVSVPLLVTDRLLQEWMRNENTIEVALFGFIPPPGTMQQRGGVTVGPSCFARAKINPINLLTCPELDAMINVDLIADKATLSDVTARMQLILAGSRVKPLSDRMGVLSVRLSLLSVETTAANAAEQGLSPTDGGLDDRSFRLPTRTIPHQITLPSTIPTQPTFNGPEDAALHYAPHQAPSTQAMTQLLTQTPAEDLRNALDRQPKPLPPKEVFLGLAVFGLVGDVVQTLRHLVRQHPQPHPDDALCVRFKISATYVLSSVSLSLSLSLSLWL